MHELLNNLSKAQVRMYGCGGGGINVVSELDQSRTEPALGFASVLPCYIDTSASNLHGKDLREDCTYLFEGIDGSGKVRSMNYEDINKNAKAILLKYKPTTFNIVVHTASGGSGSVIGPVLVSELKARGEQVIVIVIGSTDTRIETENTLKTLKSYESIAEKRNSPVVVYYVENSKTLPRYAVNLDIRSTMSILLGLLSGQNAELDTADLKNWLEYTTITKTQPRLASLVIATSPEQVENLQSVVSVATLAMPEMDTRLDSTPAYQCVGYAPAVWRVGAPNSINAIDQHPVHVSISDDFIVHSTNKLSKILKELDDVLSSRNARQSILDKNDSKTDTGLVL